MQLGDSFSHWERNREVLKPGEWVWSWGWALSSPSALRASSAATVLWIEQVYSAREPITPCTLKGLWKAAQQPMSAHESDDWTPGHNECVWMCVRHCPVGEGCMHLNWLHSLRLRGLVVFNVAIVGQNDLCGAGLHQGLNPPPFFNSHSHCQKKALTFFSGLSFPLYAPHIVKQVSHWSRNVCSLWDFQGFIPQRVGSHKQRSGNIPQLGFLYFVFCICISLYNGNLKCQVEMQWSPLETAIIGFESLISSGTVRCRSGLFWRVFITRRGPKMFQKKVYRPTLGTPQLGVPSGLVLWCALEKLERKLRR